MKTMWTIVSFLAVVNLLALLLFVGWLSMSGRLNAHRVEEIRWMLAMTVAEAEAQAEEAERDAAAERKAMEEEIRRLSPPVSSEVRIEQISRMEEMERRAHRRLDDERRLRLADIERAADNLESRKAEFEASRHAWNEQIRAEIERRRDEQFAKTVIQYESVPPRQAKNMMLELIRDGEMDQAVAYLDAMNARNAAQIIQEFKADEELRLATELLERLRSFGVPAEVAQETSNAN